VVGFRLPARTFAGQAAEQEKKPPNHVLTRGCESLPIIALTLILGKSEMGQGIMTACR